MRRLLAILPAFCVALLLFATPLSGKEEEAGKAILLEVDTPIGPATTDYIVRGLGYADESGAELVVLRLNTPGGLTSAMRDIIGAIISSEVPVAAHVAPAGARAASAGTYIMYAAHVAAMAPTTTLGAATPVQMGARAVRNRGDGADGASRADPGQFAQTAAAAGEETGQGGDEQQRPEAMERKLVEDAVAYIRSLAELRGRNAEWAEKAVRESVSISAREAQEIEVIDFVAKDSDELLAKADGKMVELPSGEHKLSSANLQLELHEPDWRNELLAVLTNPNVAYILMLIGIYGIIFELMNPGSVIPGVVGGVSLLLALYAFQALPITYAGLALMGLGIAFMITEAFMPSFGILGIGGAVSFVLGSIMLMDTEVEGFEISLAVIAGFTIASLIIFTGVATMAARAWQRPRLAGREEMINAIAYAEEDFTASGHVSYAGERWRAHSSRPISNGQRVRIVHKEGLTLQVEPDE